MEKSHLIRLLMTANIRKSFINPCLEVSTMKLSGALNLPTVESPCFSGLFFFEIV